MIYHFSRESKHFNVVLIVDRSMLHKIRQSASVIEHNTFDKIRIAIQERLERLIRYLQDILTYSVGVVLGLILRGADDVI
jgi:hypothetical protein